MAGSNKYERPSRADLEAALAEHGTVTSYARALGIPRPTVQHWFEDEGLKAASRPQKVKAAPPTLGSAISREEILEQENKELRAALRGERRSEVKNERLMVAIERALEATDPPAPLGYTPLPPTPSEHAHHRALLLLSDAHGGEHVKAAAVNGLNEYSWDICAERHEELLLSVASHIRRMPPLTGLDLAILGDNCSGANHRELEVSNEYPLAVQGIKMGYLLGDFVTQLASMVNDVRVVSVPGNHPRLTEKPAAKDADNNMDVVATFLAEERTRSLDNVTWRQPEGAAIFHEIAGRVFYIWHGDGVRSAMPGVPWGGVMRRTNELQARHGRHIDHFVLGHFHQANVVQSGRILMNGSVKGVDEWVLKSFGGGDPPTQLLVLLDEKRQRLTDIKFLTPTAGLPHGD